MEDGCGGGQSVSVRFLSACLWLTYVWDFFTLFFPVQKSTYTQTRTPSFETQANYVGSAESQRGAEAETYARWREQTESREEECGTCGTDLDFMSNHCSKIRQIILTLHQCRNNYHGFSR